MLLPGRNHLSQVSTTCSDCIYHIGSLPLTPPRGSSRFASRRSSSTCRHRRRHIRTRVHARKQIWMANYGDNDAELDGDRKETGDSFRRHARARDSLPHRNYGERIFRDRTTVCCA